MLESVVARSQDAILVNMASRQKMEITHG